MRNPFSRIPQPRECTSNHGESVKIIYRGRYKDDGTVELVKSDELDIQKEINSYSGLCDLRYLMQRFNCGDVSVMQQGNPMYGDFPLCLIIFSICIIWFMRLSGIFSLCLSRLSSLLIIILFSGSPLWVINLGMSV